MNLSTECLEEPQVDSLLQGNLTPEEFEAAQNHLELCETCRALVEATIGPAQWWSDIQSVLLNSRNGSLSQRNAPATDAEPNEPSTTRLLDLLGPTDDPNMLGRIGPYEIIGLLGQGAWAPYSKVLIDRSIDSWPSKCCCRIWPRRERLAEGSLAKAKPWPQWSMITSWRFTVSTSGKACPIW